MTTDETASPRRSAIPVMVTAVALGVLVVGPLLFSRGFALFGDMVFVPDQPWKDRWLAADGSVPRAVPSDALVSLATQILPGDLVQKAVLVALVVAAALGMARVTAAYGVTAQLAAMTLYVWNPFVYERLAIGHWALLCGYAALPWVMVGARAVRDARPGGWLSLAVPLLVAAWTSPSGGVLSSLVALAVVLGRPRLLRTVGTLGIGVGLNLPWLVPGALAVGGTAGDPSGVSAFAATSDTPLGTFGSLLTFGGMWKTSVAAPGRDSWVLVGLMALVVVAGLVGVVLARRDRTIASLIAVAVVGLLLAWLPATGAGAEVATWLVGHVPGAGLLRDSQKWIAPYVLLVSAGLAATVSAATAALRQRDAQTGWLALVVLLPVVTLPGLAWGQFGRLDPVNYPDEWSRVADLMASHGAADDRTVVLPFEVYRRYPWNGERAVLDPAPRFFPGEVVTNDALPVGGNAVVAGDDPVAAKVGVALRQPVGERPAALRSEGVRWLLVQTDAPGAADLDVPVADVVFDGERLRLLDLGASQKPLTDFRGRSVVIGVDAVVGVAGVLILGAAAARRIRRYTPSEHR